MLATITFWTLFGLSPQGNVTSQLHGSIKIGEYASASDCQKGLKENISFIPKGVSLTYICQETSEVIRPKLEMPWKLISETSGTGTNGIVTVLGEYNSIGECNKYLHRGEKYKTACINTGK